jgi:hypothetical protein
MKTKNEIKKIAYDDAVKIYRDLSLYEVSLVRKLKIWYVSFNLIDKGMIGGGPYYEIDADTGIIIQHIYYQ